MAIYSLIITELGPQLQELVPLTVEQVEVIAVQVDADFSMVLSLVRTIEEKICIKQTQQQKLIDLLYASPWVNSLWQKTWGEAGEVTENFITENFFEVDVVGNPTWEYRAELADEASRFLTSEDVEELGIKPEYDKLSQEKETPLTLMCRI